MKHATTIIRTVLMLLLLAVPSGAFAQELTPEQQLVIDALRVLTSEELDQVIIESQEFQLRNPGVPLEEINAYVSTLIIERAQRPLPLKGQDDPNNDVNSLFESDSMIPTSDDDLNTLEIKFCLTNVYYCGKTYRYSRTAISTAASYYSRSELSDGRGDAFRHAFWNVLMVRGTSLSWAKNFAAVHEVGDPGNVGTLRFDMDVWNNGQGQSIGQTAANNSTSTQLEKVVNSYVKDGKLMIINKNGKLVRSNK